MSQLWDYLDEELTEDRLAAVRRHLDTCSGCLPHAQFAESFLGALGRCKHQGTMPPQVREGVMTALKRAGLI